MWDKNYFLKRLWTVQGAAIPFLFNWTSLTHTTYLIKFLRYYAFLIKDIVSILQKIHLDHFVNNFIILRHFMYYYITFERTIYKADLWNTYKRGKSCLWFKTQISDTHTLSNLIKFKKIILKRNHFWAF